MTATEMNQALRECDRDVYVLGKHSPGMQPGVGSCAEQEEEDAELPSRSAAPEARAELLALLPGVPVELQPSEGLCKT